MVGKFDSEEGRDWTSVRKQMSKNEWKSTICFKIQEDKEKTWKTEHLLFNRTSLLLLPYSHLDKKDLDRLQVVRNSAAGFFTHINKQAHVPSQHRFSFFPVQLRICFKTLVVPSGALAPIFLIWSSFTDHLPGWGHQVRSCWWYPAPILILVGISCSK